MIEDSYEAIVVGSGATGGVAALTLASSGVSVLVVEAGPSLSADKAFGSEPINTIQRLCGIITGKHRQQIQHPGYWKANPSLYINEKDNPYTYPSEFPFIWTQGRQVGGRSLTWGGITLRLCQSDFKAARTDGFGSEWPIEYSDLIEHYLEVEKLLKVHGNQDGLDQLPDGEYIPYLPFTESESDFANQVSSKLGYPVIHSRGFGIHSKELDGPWPRSSSPGSTLRIAIKTGKVQVLENHLAESLVIGNNKASAEGINVINTKEGSRKLLKGKLIVLCSSTIQTIKILLNSKEKYNDSNLIDESGKLGCYLMDHISSCRFFAIPNPKKSSTAENYHKESLSGAGSFFIPFGNKLDASEEVNFLRGYGIWGAIDRFEPPGILKRKPNSKIGFLIGHGEVLPYKDNRVTLSNRTDKWGIPIPHINCKWKDNERKMVRHMNKTIERAIESAGGEVLELKELIRMPFFEQITQKALAVQKEPPPPGYYIHEVGGAQMGDSKYTSVVDPFNRLWNLQNVLVVDGACWPTSSWQSPTLTMMAITRRACLQAALNLKG